MFLRRDGEKYRAQCKNCYNNAQSEYRKSSPKWRETRQAWINKNRDKVKKWGLEHYYRNQKAMQDAQKEYYEATKKERRNTKYKYFIKNRKQMQKQGRLHAKNMTDCYIAGFFKISVTQCPPELIELKREQLKLYRACK